MTFLYHTYYGLFVAMLISFRGSMLWMSSSKKHKVVRIIHVVLLFFTAISTTKPALTHFIKQQHSTIHHDDTRIVVGVATGFDLSSTVTKTTNLYYRNHKKELLRLLKTKKYRRFRLCPIRIMSTAANNSNNRNSNTEVTFLDALSKAASESLGRTIQFQSTMGGGYSGGGGASTSAVLDPVTGQKYFIKSAYNYGRRNNNNDNDEDTTSTNMLYAEYCGVKAIADTSTIKVPTPIAYGTYELKKQSFVIFEYLEMCGGGGSQYELGQQVAKMHQQVSPNNMYGFDINNTIGATPQPNTPWMKEWSEFWIVHRLQHMLSLTNNARMDDTKTKRLIETTKYILSSHKPVPSLLHGDLWGGNKGFCKIQIPTTTTTTTSTTTNDDDHDGTVQTKTVVVPCIFDPATYYGDRETDIAMTYLFGGYTNDFYKGYDSIWPLPSGHEQRRTIYNLYHILNHDVLFGGGYINQARGMIDTILGY